MIDPKKDPWRRCRPVEEWAVPDRRAWEAAMTKGDILETGGDGADWAPLSRRKTAKGYGRWLTWLDTHQLLDPEAAPVDRITPERVRDYLTELRLINAPYTVLARVQELYQAIRVMAPDCDLAWLRRIEARVRHQAVSVRGKRQRVMPSETLFRYGVELIATADDRGTGSLLKRACRFRDGLMIAVLAARPLRRRNFARIKVGRHLVQVDGAYQLRFEGSETKTGGPIETPFPAALVAQLERYLTEFRPPLLQRASRKGQPLQQSDPSLWISVHGVAMTEIGIYFAISQLTRKRFGHVVSPHLFRDSAATSIAIEVPEHVHIVRSVLGHSSLITGERHYIQARTLEASRRYQQHILELRQQSNASADRQRGAQR
jgi:integrase/recombinase XerD